MRTLFRQDRLRQDLAPPVPGPGGALLVTGVAARAGIYLYLNADGSTRRELVDEDCLANPENGIATLGRAPLTLQHPSVMVNADNAAKYGVGDVDSQIYVAEGGYVTVRMAVRTSEAQDALAEGTVELSPGYLVTVDDTPGTHPVFGDYDSRQVKREYNHLAIVDAARGGPECRIALDGAAVSEEIRVNTKTDPEVVPEATTDAAETAPTTATETTTEVAPETPAPVADEVTYQSTSEYTEETAPDGTVTYTSTSETTVKPSPALPEGVTPEMVEFIKAIVAACMGEKNDDKAEVPPAEPAPTVDTAPVLDALDAPASPSYRVRRSLERRYDGQGVDDLTTADIASAILRKYSVSLDGLSAQERIDKALALPEVATVDVRVDDQNQPKVFVDRKAYAPTPSFLTA